MNGLKISIIDFKPTVKAHRASFNTRTISHHKPKALHESVGADKGVTSFPFFAGYRIVHGACTPHFGGTIRKPDLLLPGDVLVLVVDKASFFSADH